MKHPYVGLPDFQFWKRDPAVRNGADLDPVTDVPFVLGPTDKIVTAGSCFAQHVARYLNDSGYCHYIAEPAHPIVPAAVAATHNYGLFSARYGNIYTARQLWQLLQRAYGLFEPKQTIWTHPSGDGYVDPFRPQIQPGGYETHAEIGADQNHHLAAVRDAIETMDCFVFTLGLTEAWQDKDDGAVYPLAPGVAGGQFDPDQHGFVNFDEVETYDDLNRALAFIRSKNPTVKFILTVSPVPLNATYEPRHVLASTTWSKSVLRIVAEKAARAFENTTYFPSFEIITSPHVRGAYYDETRREVTERGVAHVMGLFMEHFTARGPADRRPLTQATKPVEDAHKAEMTAKIQTLCDESKIDNT